MMLVVLVLLGRHHEVVRVPLLMLSWRTLLLEMVALLQLLFLGVVRLRGLRLGRSLVR